MDGLIDDTLERRLAARGHGQGRAAGGGAGGGGDSGASAGGASAGGASVDDDSLELVARAGQWSEGHDAEGPGARLRSFESLPRTQRDEAARGARRPPSPVLDGLDSLLTFWSPGKPADTQRIAQGSDTQVIGELGAADTQVIGADTQAVTQRMRGATRARGAAQVIGAGGLDVGGPREIGADTQVIGATQADADPAASGAGLGLRPGSFEGSLERPGLGSPEPGSFERPGPGGLEPGSRERAGGPLSQSSPQKSISRLLAPLPPLSGALSPPRAWKPLVLTPVAPHSPSLAPSPARASMSVVQIPNTVERAGPESLAQVQNTQEDLVDTTFQLEPRAVFLSSQKLEREEVCTDDERAPRTPPPMESDELSDVDEEEGVVVRKKRKLVVTETQLQGGEAEAEAAAEADAKAAPPSASAAPTPPSASAPPSTPPPPLAPPVLTLEPSITLPPSHVVNRDSVWAEYKFKMYPGVVQTRGRDSLEVLFDDGVSTVPNADLYLLDLRVGDHVRVQRQAARFEVVALSRGEGAVACVRNYSVVRVRQTKGKRAEHAVPMGQVYMEIGDWVEHQLRFALGEPEAPRLARVAAPSRALSRAPLARSSPTKARAAPRAGRAGIFKGALFCLTNSEFDDHREELLRLIEENGGAILDAGLHEVMELAKGAAGGALELEAMPSLREFSFFAVLSNNYCRSAKYLEALAVGWPILLDVFVHDAVKHGSGVAAWPRYLLPAGFLQRMGCVRLLEVFDFRVGYGAGLDLAAQLSRRNRILSDAHVLVMQTDKRNLCEFIFHALGARRLSYVAQDSDVLAAADGGLNLIYEGNASMLKERKGVARRRKSGRRGRGGATVRLAVIDWEWVVQCIINSCIWDDLEITECAAQ